MVLKSNESIKKSLYKHIGRADFSYHPLLAKIKGKVAVVYAGSTQTCCAELHQPELRSSPLPFVGPQPAFCFAFACHFCFLNWSNLCRLCSSGSAALRGSVGEAIRQPRTFSFPPALRLLQAPMTGRPPVGAGLHPTARPPWLGATATACFIGPRRAVKHP